MAHRQMQNHLRKTEKPSKEDQFWHKLHSKALDAARQVEDSDAVADLESFQDNPEDILRRMSIISEEDVYREFGGED